MKALPNTACKPCRWSLPSHLTHLKPFTNQKQLYICSKKKQVWLQSGNVETLAPLENLRIPHFSYTDSILCRFFISNLLMQNKECNKDKKSFQHHHM